MTSHREKPRHLSDLGNADRFIARHGDDVRHVPEWGYVLYDGRHWKRDRAGAVMERGRETVLSILDEAKRATRDDERAQIAKHAASSQRTSAIKHMLEQAQCLPPIAAPLDQFDQRHDLLTVNNGTIDLTTGQLREHRRDDYLTKLVPIDYNPAAECREWIRFLNRVLNQNEAMIAYLQLAIGYSLTGLTWEQCLFFLYGSGANGKSVFLNVLCALLGEYATRADFATLLEKRGDGPRNDLARLHGARVVTSSEAGEGKRFNENLVKQITGSETIAARYLYSEAFEFDPTFKLWLAANHKPVIRGTDDAIWRRLRLIPFTVQIPEAERDQRLTDKLRGELPGILAWAVKGCVAWYAEGRLPTPPEVVTATTTYRQESDTFATFLVECCVLSPNERESAQQLLAHYNAWADRSEQLSQKALGNRLTDKNFAKLRDTKTGRIYYIGLRLAAEGSEGSEGSGGVNQDLSRARAPGKEPEIASESFNPSDDAEYERAEREGMAA